MFMSPSVVSTWASIGPSDTSAGASVMTRFMRILWGGAPPLPSYSARMAFAWSSHSSLRKLDTVPPGTPMIRAHSVVRRRTVPKVPAARP